jgi:hypothetical protein
VDRRRSLDDDDDTLGDVHVSRDALLNVLTTQTTEPVVSFPLRVQHTIADYAASSSSSATPSLGQQDSENDGEEEKQLHNDDEPTDENDHDDASEQDGLRRRAPIDLAPQTL